MCVCVASLTAPKGLAQMSHGLAPSRGVAITNTPHPQVLAQQRAEQQRRELATGASSDSPLDPVTFIQTLPSELRRSVLEDMEDSVLAVMPPDIAAEAQALRREQEARQRQLMHERLFGHSSTSALSAILRSPGESPMLWPSTPELGASQPLVFLHPLSLQHSTWPFCLRVGYILTNTVQLGCFPTCSTPELDTFQPLVFPDPLFLQCFAPLFQPIAGHIQPRDVSRFNPPTTAERYSTQPLPWLFHPKAECI